MKKLLFRPAARRDLIEIRAYTVRNWGKLQAVEYLSSIEACVGRINAQPEHGSLFPTDIGEYRRVKCGSHYVFYRVSPDVVAIIRILHEKMDFERHLA